MATGLLVTLWVGYGVAELHGVVDLPGAATVAANAALGLLAQVGVAATARRSQAAFDEAGGEVLRRAGYDPVSLTLQVFGNRRDPSWWVRLHSREPTPSARVAAVERRSGPDVAPPEAPSRGSPPAREG